MRKVFTILLVLFPFLNQFGLPVNVPFLTEHLSIGYLVVLPFALLWLLLKLPTEGIFRLKVYGFSGYVLFLLAAAFSAVMARGRAYYAGNRQLLAFGILLLPANFEELRPNILIDDKIFCSGIVILYDRFIPFRPADEIILLPKQLLFLLRSLLAP